MDASVAPNDELTRQIAACFKIFDRNGDGSISKLELRAVLCKIGQGRAVEEDDVDRCMEEADTNQNGYIELDEFMQWMMCPTCVVSVGGNGAPAAFDFDALLRPLYDIYDRDGNGTVSYAEFEECHCILQNSLGLQDTQSKHAGTHAAIEGDVHSIFKGLDNNNDKNISFPEFVEWQKKRPRPVGTHERGPEGVDSWARETAQSRFPCV